MCFISHSTVVRRDYKYELTDVRKNYIALLENVFNCKMDRKRDEFHYNFVTQTNIQYEMLPGEVEVTFTPLLTGCYLKVDLYVRHLASYKREAWINKTLEYLEARLKKEGTEVTVKLTTIKCPKCKHEFEVNSRMDMCICPRCKTRLNIKHKEL